MVFIFVSGYFFGEYYFYLLANHYILTIISFILCINYYLYSN